MNVGDTFSWKRTFTRGDVIAFSNITGDFGSLHTIPDAKGRVRVHSLLIASIATKIGGDLDFFSEKLDHTFLKPVYTGEEIWCKITITDVVSLENQFFLEMSLVFSNEANETVATGKGTGSVPKHIS